MTATIPARRQEQASATRSMALAVRPTVGVLGGESMSVIAVRLACVAPGDRLAAQDVFATGDDFQMARADTPPIATEMVNRHSWRNLAVQLPIDIAVSECLPPSGFQDVKDAIAARGRGSLPCPASRISAHVAPESHCLGNR